MDSVIKALGGRKAVSELTGRQATHVFNWLNVERKFPAHTYLIMQDALHKRGYTASPRLWGITEPARDP
jgi:hypothetical protein